MNIFEKINEVRKVVDYVRKEKTVGEGGGYKVVTHDQITALTREHFVRLGIVIYPVLTSQRSENTGTTTSRGTPFIRFEATYRFEVVNAQDPTDRFSVEIAAHALDQGDKAPGKALSYAKKYCVLKLLEIESGEEEEDRAEQHAPKEAKVTPNSGAGDSLTGKQKSMIRDTATLIVDALNDERDVDALGYCESIVEVEEKLFLWSLLGSAQRRRIKEASARAKNAKAN
jgi:hypothetical protein